MHWSYVFLDLTKRNNRYISGNSEDFIREWLATLLVFSGTAGVGKLSNN